MTHDREHVRRKIDALTARCLKHGAAFPSASQDVVSGASCIIREIACRVSQEPARDGTGTGSPKSQIL
jgi:hypothetical protein